MTTDDVIRRREQAGVSGHTGDHGVALGLTHDAEPSVRATAFQALHRMGLLTQADVDRALEDSEAEVRRRGCALAIGFDVDLVPLLADSDHSVAEQAAWALGERGEQAGVAAVKALSATATGHEDPLCREAAVAALGAIGDETGLPAILHGTQDKPAVRRRAVIALAPFEGPEVDAALERAKGDRDWQVRQAAEDLTSDN